MSGLSRPFPDSADQLGEALHLLRLTGTLYCRAELGAPWGISVPPLDGFMTFGIVTAGSCLWEVDGAAPLTLGPGTLVLVPHGTPHLVRSAAGVAVRDLFGLPVEQIGDRYEVLRHGGSGAVTQITYGVVRFDHVAAQRLVAQLPLVLRVDAWDDDWLHSTLRLIAREAAAPRAGGETVITRLADVLVVQAIRAWLDTAPEARVGWLAALRDPHVGRALTALHRFPERDWTVVALAREAGLSRSVFAGRFTELVGEPVMRYLTRWRMQQAQDRLRHTAETVGAVAHRFGYRSEAAFSRAYKRAFGVSPGAGRG
ncbi:AraC family transcriptional regulator [Actinosynnema sp. NPDC050436]|uniref:AraC family transcriptional regulator n=1 Tax=Actinosynnema sp. NPDC050436 TaxID=3155659 RepID=UPI00340C0EB9